jgi:hypothetical protein
MIETECLWNRNIYRKEPVLNHGSCPAFTKHGSITDRAVTEHLSLNSTSGDKAITFPHFSDRFSQFHLHFYAHTNTMYTHKTVMLEMDGWLLCRSFNIILLVLYIYFYITILLMSCAFLLLSAYYTGFFVSLLLCYIVFKNKKKITTIFLFFLSDDPLVGVVFALLSWSLIMKLTWKDSRR